MAHQEEEGWPLGLMRAEINGRIIRGSDDNHEVSAASLSFTCPSPSTHLSSSDLDSQSTGSFFHEKSITLGNLIGISRILELSRRSNRTRTESSRSHQKNLKSYKPWIFSLCSKLNTDAITHDKTNNNSSSGIDHPHSLAFFLQAERRPLRATTH